MEQQLITTPNVFEPKDEWSKPELTLLAVNQDTLGVNHAGGDIYASHS